MITVSEGIWYIVYLLGYGFLLTAVIGLVASWIDRKVTARVQYRVGPPLLQPAIDIVKLLGKETVIPAGASRFAFLAAPLLGLAGVIAVSTLLWVNNFHPSEAEAGFMGDLIVVVYLLTLPSLSIILGGFASRNPLASIGASREMKLILSYELPFVLAVLVPVVKSGYALKLGAILEAQQGGVFIGSWSGLLAFVVVMMCVQAKLALVPFDIPDAETEICGGPLIEYSGAPLAVYRLMKNMLLLTLPLFVIILFMGGVGYEGLGGPESGYTRLSPLYGALKYVGVVALITVVRNTNPRVRIDQAMRFFWGPMTIIAVIALALALKGW